MANIAGWAISQWRLIDEREADGSAAFDARFAGYLVLCTVLLVLLRYIGLTSYIVEVDGVVELFARWPYPDLWPRIYWSLFRVLVYVIVPGAYVYFAWKPRLAEVGFRLDRDPRVLGLYAVMFAAVFPFIYVAAQQPAFQAKYPFYEGAANSLTELLLWESAYVLQFFALEFFFRGVFLFPMAKRFGAHAVFLMTIPYTMIHFGKPLPETLGAIFTGIVLGTLALRTRSIFGGVLIHSAVGVSMDLLAL